MPGTRSRTASKSASVSKSLELWLPYLLPPSYSATIMFEPIFWICWMMYCLPVSPTVTTRISDAVPMTMPSAVKMNRILLVRKV